MRDKLHDRLFVWITQPKQHKAACLRTGTGASCVRFTDAVNRSSSDGTRKLRSGQASADTGFFGFFYAWFIRLKMFIYLFFPFWPSQAAFSPPTPRGGQSEWLSQVCSKVMMPLWHHNVVYTWQRGGGGGALHRAQASWLNWPMGRTKSGQHFVFRGFPYLVLPVFRPYFVARFPCWGVNHR